MKKFTQINESKYETLTFEDKLTQIIESLDVIVDNDPEVATKNISVKANEEFITKIKKLMVETHLKEKLSYLDKLKSTLYSGDTSWVEAEIDYIKESLNK